MIDYYSVWLLSVAPAEPERPGRRHFRGACSPHNVERGHDPMPGSHPSRCADVSPPPPFPSAAEA